MNMKKWVKEYFFSSVAWCIIVTDITGVAEKEYIENEDGGAFVTEENVPT